jgi:hypothetical protein
LANLADNHNAARFRFLIEITSCQHQPQRTLLDWLQVEREIKKPSNKPFALTDHRQMRSQTEMRILDPNQTGRGRMCYIVNVHSQYAC